MSGIGVALATMNPATKRLLMIVGGIVLVVVLFYIALTAYGNARYKTDKQDADAAWIAASNKLVEKAKNSETKAGQAQAARAADFAAKQEAEKKQLEKAQENGSSPFDVLFGSSS